MTDFENFDQLQTKNVYKNLLSQIEDNVLDGQKRACKGSKNTEQGEAKLIQTFNQNFYSKLSDSNGQIRIFGSIGFV